MNINSLLNSIMGSTGSGIDKAVTKAKTGSMPGGLMGGKAIKYGGMAAIGGMAYKAWRDHKESQSPHTLQTPNITSDQSAPLTKQYLLKRRSGIQPERLRLLKPFNRITAMREEIT